MDRVAVVFGFQVEQFVDIQTTARNIYGIAQQYILVNWTLGTTCIVYLRLGVPCIIAYHSLGCHMMSNPGQARRLKFSQDAASHHP